MQGVARRGAKAERRPQQIDRLSMYDNPPSDEVQLEEFETCAIERQQLLKDVEDARTLKSDEQARRLERVLAKFGLNGRNHDEVRRDQLGHFILRLAYCRTEDLRKWFLANESALFKFRFERTLHESEQLAFVRANNINVDQISEEEYKMYAGELTRMCGDPGARTFWKVPFEEVLDLVEKRAVLLHKGQAFVPSSQLSSIVVGRFRSLLSKTMLQMHKVMPTLEHEEQYGTFLKGIGQTYFGPNFGAADVSAKGHVKIADLDMLAQRSMPLCMSNLHENLKRGHHLRHGGRLQYGLFVKGIGVTLEDALIFFKGEFSKGMGADKFDKEHAYGIRYNYGKEGARKDMSGYGCMKIISSAPAAGAGDHHGCPFRHFNNDQLTAKLRKNGLSSGAIAEITSLTKNHHYQIACKKYYSHTHGSVEPPEHVGTHPNGYFRASQEHYENLQPTKTEPDTKTNPLNMTAVK